MYHGKGGVPVCDSCGCWTAASQMKRFWLHIPTGGGECHPVSVSGPPKSEATKSFSVIPVNSSERWDASRD